MTHTQTQGADGAGTKTAGRIAHDAAYGLSPDSQLWQGQTEGVRDFWNRAGAAVVSALATPAPAATPDVPDSLRALRPEDLTDAYRRIAAQPAGQAGDAGASPVRAALEASMEARGANRQQAFFREAAARIAPAPNSTRTGAAETERLVKRLRIISSAWAVYSCEKGVVSGLLAEAAAALAARPEAPSDAGAVDELSSLHSRTERGDTRRYGSCSDSKCRHERWCQNIYACKATFGPAPSGQAEG